MLPKPDEWDTSNLPALRRAYLDAGCSFEDIAASTVADAQICQAWIEPLKHGPNNFRQVCFRIHVSKQTYDLIYNAPDGLRGRYWQSPNMGFLATRYLIDLLKPQLLKFAEECPPKLISKKACIDEMTFKEVGASLDAPSAKRWVRERDEFGSMISPNSQPQLKVRRWEINENKPENTNGPLWRWTPYDNEIEVKGALLDPTGIEHIPERKQNRSGQIHCHGFT